MNRLKQGIENILARWKGVSAWRLIVPTVFFFVYILWVEFFVKIGCDMFTARGAGLTILFTVPIALLLGLISASLPLVAGRRFLWILIVIITSLTATQLVYYDLFQTFLSLFSFTKIGMVMGNFGGDTLKLVLENLPRLIVFLIPMIFSLIFRRRLVPEGNRPWPVRVSWGSAFVIFQVIAVLVVCNMAGGITSVKYLYAEADSVDLQVPQFGVLTAARLEIERAIFPNGLPFMSEKETSEDPEELPVEDLDNPDEIPVTPPVEGVDVPVDVPEPIVYDDNVLEIDFAALAEAETDKTLADMHRYFASVTPTKQNEWTGYFEGKNLIWIVAEAYSSIAIDQELTPTLYKLSTEGFQFNNFYTPLWGVSTSDGEYVTTTGLIPKSGVWSYLRSAENSMPFGFGHLFGARDYRTLAYHNHYYSYYGRDKSHPNMGYEYYGLGNGLKVKEMWPESDVEMMEKSIPQYIEEDQFMVYYMTVSGHLGYSFGGNNMAKKHKEEVAHLPYSEAARAYMATQMELDQALEYLIAQLEAAGKLEDTVIVLSGDHYPYGLDNAQFSELLGHEVEPDFELFKSTLLLWNSAMEEPVVVDKYCASLDVMPTLANLFALPYDSRLLAGRDILSDSPGLVIFADRRFLSDDGVYSIKDDTFTTWDGSEPDYDAVRATLKDINDRFTYSRLILEKDYYSKVVPKPETE